MNQFDLLVVGAGPAGTVAARRARSLGLSVGLVHAARRRPATVESLPAAGRRLLLDLGAWPAFLGSNPTRSRGSRSWWGSDQPYESKALTDPEGPGWLIERGAFDAALLGCAIDAGAVVVSGRVRSVRRHAGHIRCELGDGRELCGRFVIDATGRAAAVASRLGARRRYSDRRVAELRHYRSPAPDRRVVIEAVRDGWWYSVGTDAGRRTVGRIGEGGTTADPPPGIRALLDGAVADGPGYRAAANSARLEPVVGPGWLAAGDAALSFDPLSSQGVLTALFTGRLAADTAAAMIDGQASAAPDYAGRLAAIARTYQHNLAQNYRAEARWPNEPFWNRV